MARPRNTGGWFVRVEAPRPGHSLTIHIAAKIFYAAGSPARVERSRVGRTVVLSPTAEEEPGTHAVSRPPGMGTPRLSIGRAALAELGLQTGTYTDVRVRDGEIVINLARAGTRRRKAP